jgi:hypothetical protein
VDGLPEASLSQGITGLISGWIADCLVTSPFPSVGRSVGKAGGGLFVSDLPSTYDATTSIVPAPGADTVGDKVDSSGTRSGILTLRNSPFDKAFVVTFGSAFGIGRRLVARLPVFCANIEALGARTPSVRSATSCLHPKVT